MQSDCCPKFFIGHLSQVHHTKNRIIQVLCRIRVYQTQGEHAPPNLCIFQILLPQEKGVTETEAATPKEGKCNHWQLQGQHVLLQLCKNMFENSRSDRLEKIEKKKAVMNFKHASAGKSTLLIHALSMPAKEHSPVFLHSAHKETTTSGKKPKPTTLRCSL